MESRYRKKDYMALISPVKLIGFSENRINEDLLRPYFEQLRGFKYSLSIYNRDYGDKWHGVLPLGEAFDFERFVTPKEFRARLKMLVRYRPTWAAEQGVPTSIRETLFTSHMIEPWASIRKLAWAGLLEEYPQDDMGRLLAGIRKHLPSEWSPTFLTYIALPPLNSGEQVTANPVEKPKAAVQKTSTTRLVLKIGGHSGAAAHKNGKAAPPANAPPKPRQGPTAPMTPPDEIEDDDYEGGTRAKRPRTVVQDARSAKDGDKKKRPGKDAGDRPPGELFGANLKKALSHRNLSKEAFNAFTDAILPGEPLARIDKSLDPWQKTGPGKTLKLGNTTGLHEYEVELCQLAELSAAEYRCQKARIFLGLACFIGYNDHCLAGEVDRFRGLQKFGKTQVQQACNIDVNKATKLYLGFKVFGWLGEDEKKAKEIPQAWLDQYPRAHREALLREICAWEVMELEKKTANPQDEKLSKWTSSVLQQFKLDVA